jgi:antibiotic biosynthesis monooxygenase (ABM) superfamily enzyme
MDLIGVAHDRNKWLAVVNAEMKVWIAQNAENFVSSFSKRTLLHGVNSWYHDKLNCTDTAQM